MQDPRFDQPRAQDGRPIEPAGSVRRTMAVVLLLVAVAFGALLVVGLDRWLPALRVWIASDPEHASGRLTVGLLVLAAFADLPLVIAGVHFLRLGQRAIEARRFPPPGITPLRPGPVLTGDAAIRRGRAAQATAFVLFGLGVAIVTALVGLVLLLRS